MSKQLMFFISLMLLVVACKSTKNVVGGEVDDSISTKKIIANHYGNQEDFKTLRGKVKIDYFNGKDRQGISVSLRMEKDKVIWISAPLGVVKAHITPEKVSFYNKLQGEYFDGDFSFLSELLGTELDFASVQNLLLGNAILDMRKEKFTSKVADGNYQLKPRKAKELFLLLFQLEPKYFKIATQEVLQPEENRFLSAEYTYQDISGKIFPNSVKVVALDKKDRTTIDLDFRNLELDKALNFPFKIPKGYEEIILK
ncbi:DUF4292 domain-containing protein [Flagellimonas meridianipacifica]|uniref:Uncharacterized protein DUF4292 n=1 Tax=Flagellimonas meridianipacifica TaxID=1080225 RepID=A0A2T0MHD8_9FLAO|nr:DUF4292 domain-containing protein [Allomuricauda pacifica]PRX56991.1 uncharacterized protein DUF4292 [Allomuricauda pacifica]